jgi:hypothetical protein
LSYAERADRIRAFCKSLTQWQDELAHLLTTA